MACRTDMADGLILMVCVYRSNSENLCLSHSLSMWWGASALCAERNDCFSCWINHLLTWLLILNQLNIPGSALLNYDSHVLWYQFMFITFHTFLVEAQLSSIACYWPSENCAIWPCLVLTKPQHPPRSTSTFVLTFSQECIVYLTMHLFPSLCHIQATFKHALTIYASCTHPTTTTLTHMLSYCAPCPCLAHEPELCSSGL